MFLSIAVPQHFYSHKFFSCHSAITDVSILSTSLNTEIERKQSLGFTYF